jgi:ketosteroid isomerase-like protein
LPEPNPAAAATTAINIHIDAFNSRDLDALMAGFTEDAVWITGTSVVRGHAELTEFFAAALSGLLPTLSIQSLIADDDLAACQLTETLTADGEPRTYSIAGFYRIRDGLIASAKIYREGSAELA